MRPLGPFDDARRVVVGVSGGADSLALAWLLSRWGAPLAVVVDHGLRPEAAAESAWTVDRLAALGIVARVRRANLAPGPARSERARAARYRLLLESCQQNGCPDLLVAHHAGDQAETVRLRQARSSGMAGLAAMAAIDFRPEARLLRPLLPVAPPRLRATLRQAGIDWIEDPTNADPTTGRGHLRATLTADDRADSLALAARAAFRRGQTEAGDAVALGGTECRPEGFAVVSAPISSSALSAVIWTISGRRHPPATAALARGLAARTVHGVLLRPAGRSGPGTLIAREPAALAPPIPACDGATWDGRFRLSGSVPSGLMLGALGSDSALFRHRSPLPAVVMAGLPALRRDGALCAVPHLAFPDAGTCRSVRLEFWPPRPVVPAPFGRGAISTSVTRGV